MDQSECEERGQNVLDFKCKNIIHGEEKSTIASQTPEKTNEHLHAKFKARGVKHLHIYDAMVELFGAMTCSLRLLSLCRKSQTFKNISAQVEVLTKSHVELVLFFGYKACGVPEATLPQPFSQKSQASLGKMPAEFPEVVGSSGGNCWMFDLEQFPLESIESLPYSADNELLLTSSHLHPAFSPRFSQKTVAVAAEKTILLTCPASVSSAVSGAMNNQAVKTWQAEESPASLVNNKCVKSKQLMELPDTCSKSRVVNPPVPPISSQRVRSHDCESPVQKLASPADSLMLETPAQVIPNRSIPSCDNKLRDMTIRDCRSCHTPAKRFIDFSHLDDERNSFGMQTDSDSVLNDEISQDVGVGANEEGNDNVSLPLLDKLEGSHGNLTDDSRRSQSEIVTDEDISVCLPNLVASIHHIFQTVNYSSITKQELVHKIIMNNLDIIERREVEEQIELLEKLVPEWISKKLVPGGDIMYEIWLISDENERSTAHPKLQMELGT
ncbi:CDT1 domain-containing protein [Citrus sinensis]|nr:CDT1 domain-containing protein [Citrus sinensis]